MKTIIHKERHELAGKKVAIKTGPMKFGHDPDELDGSEFIVEDWWDRVYGATWMHAEGNPACLKYAIRSACVGLPIDNEVVYGKVGMLGHLVHNNELEMLDKGESPV